MLWDFIYSHEKPVNLRSRLHRAARDQVHSKTDGFGLWAQRHATHALKHPRLPKTFLLPASQANVMTLAIRKERRGTRWKKKGGGHVCVLPWLAQRQKKWLYKWKQREVKCPHLETT